MNQEIPDSPPLVTYPPDAAAPGYNWQDNRPSPTPDYDEIYVPVSGDEDYVESDFTICREPNAPPFQSLSAMMRAQSISFATPSVPSLHTSTNPARSGASLSTASAAAPQFRLSSLLSSAPAALPSLRTAAPTLLSGIPALSFAAATVPSLQNLNANEVLPNFRQILLLV